MFHILVVTLPKDVKASQLAKLGFTNPAKATSSLTGRNLWYLAVVPRREAELRMELAVLTGNVLRTFQEAC